jgi:hypothetical protein
VIGQVLVSREASKPPKRAFPAVFTSSKKVSNAFARSVKPRYQILAHPLAGLAAAHRTVASSRLIRCTVPTPTPSAAAILRSPGRFFLLKAVCTAHSVFSSIFGRPSCLPSALANPARTRSWIIARSNSANTPSGERAFTFGLNTARGGEFESHRGYGAKFCRKVGVSPMLPQSANSSPRSGRSFGCRRVFSDRQRC